MKKKIKEVLFTFACVTTCIVVASNLFLSLFWVEQHFDSQHMKQTICVAFVTSLGNFIYPAHKELTKKAMWGHIILHYLYINIVVLGFGIYFDWIYFYELKMVYVLLIMITIIFALVWGVNQYRGRLLAKKLNERLAIYNKGEK